MSEQTEAAETARNIMQEALSALGRHTSTTEADKCVETARDNVQEALSTLGRVIAKDVEGWDEFSNERRDVLRKAFQLILEASDLL